MPLRTHFDPGWLAPQVGHACLYWHARPFRQRIPQTNARQKSIRISSGRPGLFSFLKRLSSTLGIFSCICLDIIATRKFPK